MTQVPTRTLPSGDQLPAVGFGTYRLHDETVKAAVRAALDAGYVHVDTAEGYHNESEIGEVLTASDTPDRDDLFLTSKVLAKNLNYESVLRSCRESLDSLGTDYLDLYLIHWPNPAISLRETLAAMAKLKAEGRVRNVGVSNFSAYQLSAAHHVSDVPIAVNQIEFHPYFQRPDLVEYCHESDTVLEAAAPLARTQVFDDPTITEIADDYDRTPAQAVCKWALQRDVVVLPRSSTPDHVRSNYELFDWELDDEALARIDALDRDEPVYDHPTRDWTDDVWGIAE